MRDSIIFVILLSLLSFLVLGNRLYFQSYMTPVRVLRLRRREYGATKSVKSVPVKASECSLKKKAQPRIGFRYILVDFFRALALLPVDSVMQVRIWSPVWAGPPPSPPPRA